MEALRAPRIETAGVLPPLELATPHASRFLEGYLAQLREPLHLMNHVAVLPFASREEDVRKRQEGLVEYFGKDSGSSEDWMWGRTLVAETVSQQVIQAALGHALEANGMYVSNVPTSIDSSSAKDEIPPRKGVDHCIVQMQSTELGTVLVPMLGIDVTTGKMDLVKSKRKRPAIQCPTAMPAIVVPLGGLVWDGRKAKPFLRYLDEHARREILERGVYTPFYGLDPEDANRWKHTMREEILKGLAACRDNLAEHHADPGLEDYPYIQGVLDKVAAMEALVQSAASHSHTGLV
jgi:hypothetical protein